MEQCEEDNIKINLRHKLLEELPASQNNDDLHRKILRLRQIIL